MPETVVRYLKRLDLLRAISSSLALVLILCSAAAADEDDSAEFSYFGAGLSYAPISDYPSKLKGILREPKSINSLEFYYGEKLDGNWAVDTMVSMQKNGDMNLYSAQAGIRYDLGPIPKTFFTPWIGGYLVLDLLDDRTGWEQEDDEGEDWDGFGLGLAWRAGLSVKVGALTALQLSYGRSRFGALGVTEGLKGYGGHIAGERYSVVLIIYATPEEDIFFE